MKATIHRYTFDFSAADWQALEAYAKSQKSTVARIIRLSVEDYLHRMAPAANETIFNRSPETAAATQAASSANATAEKANPPAIQPPNAPGVAGAVSALPVADVPASGDLPGDYEPKFTGKNPPKPAGDQS